MSSFLDVRREYIWPKMEDICRALVEHRRVAVKAGHAVSKTYTAARLAMWFLYAFGPRATVITTAPSHNQVEGVLWREIRDCHANSKVELPGKVTLTQIDLAERWFALGFATKADTVTQQATRFQGWHNDHVLVIFDEAAGVLSQIWAAAEGLLTTGHTRFLGIGNPTSPVGEFVNCFDTDEYYPITISVLDTPNYKEGREVIPGLAGRDYEARMRRKFGEDSPIYQSRVLGVIPEYAEGIIYGREMSDVKHKGRIAMVPYDPAYPVYTGWDLGSRLTGPTNAIWFVQLVGQQLRFIDFITDVNRGLQYFAKEIKDKPYVYGGHFAGPDLSQASVQTGQTTIQFARQLGIPLIPVRPHRIEDGIQAVRSILSHNCWFDAKKCRFGIDALCSYHRVKNESQSTLDHPVFHSEPAHDWSCHPSDAFRHIAMAYRQGLIRLPFDGADEDEDMILANSYAVETAA